jgi:carbon storage regulator
MLVLSRKKGQSLLIAGNTVLRVLEVKGNQIRLGIEAPDDVAVMRAELTDRHMASACPRDGREPATARGRIGTKDESTFHPRRSR